MSATLPLPTVAPVPPLTVDDFPADRLMRLTVEQYHRMREIGVLLEDEPVELLDGWILRKHDDDSPFRGPEITLPAREGEEGFVIPLDQIRRITVPEYHRMIDAGVLTEFDRVELLDGYLVTKMARNPPHDGTLALLLRLLARALPIEWGVRGQSAIELTENEPEPDIAIVRPDPDEYTTRHPDVRDIVIAIEVSDTTLRHDQRFKLGLYARENVPEYWVVNIPDRQIEVFTQPSPEGYQSHQVFPVGTVVPVVLDGQPVTGIDVAQLFR